MLTLALTWLFPVMVLYFALFAALWIRTRFLPRRGRTSRTSIRVTPWGAFLHIDAPSEAAAADALLRADLDLSARGQ